MSKKSHNQLAIFDIDGTIFRKNLHFELINELAWLKVVSHEVRSKLTEIYASWIQHEGTYEDYRKAIVELYSRYITGCAQADVLRACKILVPFHAKRTYIFAERLMEKLRSEGFRMIAVSGSPQEVVEEYNSHYLKFDKVFGSIYALDAEKKYTGVASFEPSKNKGEVVKQYVFEHNLTLEGSYGVGDTESDISFLNLVEHPIAFNPNQNLKATAEEGGWRIIVEKKDVIYEIKNDCLTEPLL